MRKEIKGLSVRVNDSRQFDKSLRKFKKKVEEDGRLKSFKNRQEFVSKSEQRKIDKKRARSRHLKKLRDEQKMMRRD